MSKHTVWETNPAPYRELLGKDPIGCSVDEIARTRPQVQRLLAAARTTPFFIKTHLGVASIEGCPTINFEITLAAVYVVRNALDVTISYADFFDREIDRVIEDMADPALGVTEFRTSRF